MEKIRYHLLDGWRGLLLINMIAYHAIWDLVYLYGVNMPWYRGVPGHTWQRFICMSFILLSGFCFPLGSKGLKRGITVFLGGVIVTAVTMVVLPDMPALFGVLTLIGSCMILAVPLHKVFSKIPSLLGFAMSLLLFIILYDINDGIIDLFYTTVNVPESFFANYFTAYLGFPQPGFSSSDYFPILPWVFLFFTGYFFNGLVSKYLPKVKLLRLRVPMLSFCGRNSLIIYLLHQPVIYIVLMLVM